jgi:Xaa-Pro aminopeptidase
VSTGTAPDLLAAVRTGWDLGAPLPLIDVSSRAAAVAAGLAAAGPDGTALDALVVTDLVNVRWLTGFTGSAATVVVLADGTISLVTDGRYAERAEAELRAAGSRAAVGVGRTQQAQRELLVDRLGGAATIGLEADHVSWTRAEELRAAFAPAAVVPSSGAVESLRRTKSTAELALTARACAVADAAFARVVDLLAAGVTEAAFARAFEAAVLEAGGDDLSFPSIIAAGPNGSRPHHQPGDRPVQDGELVICDLGALVGGYHSDMTRTVLVGDVSKAGRRHFEVVRRAQAAGVSAVRSGTPAKDVDAACREVIADAGWGELFVHGTGHGTGLVIHEIPFAGAQSTDVLRAGDLLTVEPGVYLPGEAGVRIEDLLLVTHDGAIALTRTPIDVAVG